jgi:7-cyano-7-deazaguanine synthase
MTVAVLSGGLDSTVMLAWLRHEHHVVSALSFDYGQRHVRELDSARDVANVLGVDWRVVNLTGLRRLLAHSALTDDAVAVPDGHYAEDSMRATIVPNRNAIMLAVATAVAVADKHDAVAFGAHAGDHFVYPDCRPPFVTALQTALRLGNEGMLPDDFAILAPFLTLTKAEVVALGAEMNAPLHLTWSCYRGGDVHCGTCGTCVERREAFTLAGVVDPTRYHDPQ